MNKRPEIIKRIRRAEIDSVNTSESSSLPKTNFSQEEASPYSATSVDEFLEQKIELFEVPRPTEYGEAIEPPPPINPNSVSAWEPELREIAWEHESDVWETFLYD